MNTPYYWPFGRGIQSFYAFKSCLCNIEFFISSSFPILLQEFESFVRNHNSQRSDIEDLAQALMNSHVMVASVSSDLQDYKNKGEEMEKQVRMHRLGGKYQIIV